MTVNDMINKYRLELHPDGDKLRMPTSIAKKTNKAEMEALKAAKPEIIAELKRQKEEWEARKAAEKAAHEAQKQALRDGKTPIRLRWHDGEILSGYMPADQATSEVLVELGLAKYVEGWGLYVDARTVEALGPEFSFAQASALCDSRKREVEKKAQQEADLTAKLAEAKETGKPILLRKWTTGCCDPKEECSVDVHYEFAMPDGTTKHKQHHTW
jgi:hypothetical protein